MNLPVFFRNLFLLFIILFGSNKIYSQNKIDSLEQLLNKTITDTSRINLINKLAVEYIRIDLGKSHEYSILADSLSRIINYTYGSAEGLRNLGVYYMYKSNIVLALQTLHKALFLFEKAKSIEGKANCLLAIGATYNQMNNNDSALYYYQNSLDLWLQIGGANKERIAAIYNNLGITYRKTGNIPLALEYYQKSLMTKGEINDKAGAGDTYHNIGVIYSIMNDMGKAIEYYRKAETIWTQVGYEIGVAKCYNNMALAFSNIENFDSTVFYAGKALDINLPLHNNRGIAHSYNILGDMHYRKNELNLALDFYKKGINYAEKADCKQVISICYVGIAEISLKLLDFKKAYLLGNKALDIANEIEDMTAIMLSSKLLADVCANMGNYQEAYKFHKLHKAMSDSIQNDANSKKILSLEYEYKYQKDKIEQEKTRLEQKARLDKQKNITLSFIIGFCLVLGLAFYIFQNLRRKQKDIKIISTQKLQIEEHNLLLNSQKEEIQTQNELLHQQAKKLTEISDIKSHFFTNISHELRTPLTLIISPLIQAIETNNCDKATLDIMYRNARKLLDMIDELLQLTRMEKGAIDLHLEYANINALIKGVVNSFEALIIEKGITLETEGIDKKCMASFDPACIEKVVTNLLSNAIKFTPHGKRIKLAAFSDNINFNLHVSDEGIGVPESETGKIFDRFYRASNSMNIFGTGIGLSLVSDIVTLHGGTIKTVQSEFGGAKFIVSLPLNRLMVDDAYETNQYADENNVIQPDKSIKTNVSQNYTLLIIEDNNDLRNFLASSFTALYNILTADNGKTGLEIAIHQQVDIIVSDVMMPEMDGYMLTKTIRKNPDICHIPIILLTAKSSEQSIIAGLETEADAYITKPFSLSYLKAVLANQLKIRDKLRSRFQKKVSVSPSEITTTSLDEQFIINATKIVEDNIHNECFSVDVFCNALLMSRTSVHRKITAITGLSSSDFIRTIRLKRAALLIKGKAASISEISTMVGFSDVSYFTKCFKKQFRTTPSAFQSNG